VTRTGQACGIPPAPAKVAGVAFSLFPRFRPRAELRPEATGPAPSGALRIRWLGTAGHVLETRSTTILIDPYLTRSPIGTLVASRLVPDEAAIRAAVPSKVDAVLCGHSHFDHLLDAPLIVRTTGATLFGSPTTCAFARAEGVRAEQLIEVGAEGLETAVGDFEIRFIPSLHGRLLFGRVPFPGEVSEPPRLPARAWHYRMGGAFGILVSGGGTSVYHNGSADLVDAAIVGTRADVLLIGIAGRRATRDYVARLCGLLRPSVVVPTHHDAFFAPLERGVHLLPGIDLDGFVSEVGRVAPRSQVITPSYQETLWFDAVDRRGFLAPDGPTDRSARASRP
jgi:L-ascorbate metabolism protein UlaG (beta-lactamase superfamily)